MKLWTKCTETETCSEGNYDCRYHFLINSSVHNFSSFFALFWSEMKFLLFYVLFSIEKPPIHFLALPAFYQTLSHPSQCLLVLSRFWAEKFTNPLPVFYQTLSHPSQCLLRWFCQWAEKLLKEIYWSAMTIQNKEISQKVFLGRTL